MIDDHPPGYLGRVLSRVETRDDRTGGQSDEHVRGIESGGPEKIMDFIRALSAGRTGARIAPDCARWIVDADASKFFRPGLHQFPIERKSASDDHYGWIAFARAMKVDPVAPDIEQSAGWLIWRGLGSQGTRVRQQEHDDRRVATGGHRQFSEGCST